MSSPDSGSSGSSGSGSPGGPSITEIGWCLIPWHWSACSAAQGHADAASAAAQSLFPSSLHNGKGDAFRHCYWNARMTIDFGADKAKTIADNHEDGSDGPEAEKNMDRSNNASGRKIGGSASGSNKEKKYASAKTACQNAANNGQLVTLK